MTPRWTPRAATAAVAIPCCALLAPFLAACGDHHEPATPALSPTMEQFRPADADLQHLLRDLVEEVQTRHRMPVGIAVTSGDRVVEAGDSAVGPAWSTIKVPIAVAAYRAHTADPTTVDAAITISDNDAATELWNTLSTNGSAPEAVEQVLRSGGDDQTTLADLSQEEFGQTTWPLARQASFVSHLPCLAEAADVLDYMSDITQEHRYGLGVIETMAFKGGWGDDDDGRFTTRQMGVIDGIGVAIFADPGTTQGPSGDREVEELERSGRAALDDLARGFEQIRTQGKIVIPQVCPQPHVPQRPERTEPAPVLTQSDEDAATEPEPAHREATTEAGQSPEGAAAPAVEARPNNPAQDVVEAPDPPVGAAQEGAGGPASQGAASPAQGAVSANPGAGEADGGAQEVAP